MKSCPTTPTRRPSLPLCRQFVPSVTDFRRAHKRGGSTTSHAKRINWSTMTLIGGFLTSKISPRYIAVILPLKVLHIANRLSFYFRDVS